MLTVLLVTSKYLIVDLPSASLEGREFPGKNCRCRPFLGNRGFDYHEYMSPRYTGQKTKTQYRVGSFLSWGAKSNPKRDEVGEIAYDRQMQLRQIRNDGLCDALILAYSCRYTHESLRGMSRLPFLRSSRARPHPRGPVVPLIQRDLYLPSSI